MKTKDRHLDPSVHRGEGGKTSSFSRGWRARQNPGPARRRKFAATFLNWKNPNLNLGFSGGWLIANPMGFSGRLDNYGVKTTNEGKRT
jgi:hypothetical protein